MRKVNRIRAGLAVKNDLHVSYPRSRKRAFSGALLREMRAKNGVGRPPRLKAYTHLCRAI